jgi:hypothetical protein
MLHTYQAILHGDRLEWRGAPPTELVPERPVAVHVTILEQSEQEDQPSTTGRRMAALLEQLAHIQTFTDIPDPSDGQRMIREDRELPVRGS